MVSQLPKTEENTCLTIKIRTKFACKDNKLCATVKINSHFILLKSLFSELNSSFSELKDSLRKLKSLLRSVKTC